MAARPLPVINSDTLPFQPSVEWCVESLIAQEAGTILAGQPGVSKTVHAAYLAICVALGLDFGSFHVPKAQNVLYIDYDSSYAQLRPLFEAISAGLGYTGIPDNIFFYFPGDPHCRFDDGTSPPNSLGDLGEAIVATVDEHHIGLIIVDSLMQTMSGDPSSASDAITALRQGLSPALHHGAAVLVIDHTTKSVVGSANVPTPFGSQLKRAWSRISIILESEEVSGQERIRWSIDKSNFAKFPSFWTAPDFQNEDGQLVEVKIEFFGTATPRAIQRIKNTRDSAAQEEILRLLAESSQVERKCIPRGGTYDRALKTLVETSKITKISHGVYALPDMLDTEQVDHTTTPDPPE